MNAGETGTWQLITDSSGFADLRSDWEALFASNPRHRPFQSWGWTVAWLENLAGPHTLHLVCYRDKGGRLAFVLPMIRSDANGSYGSPRLISICGYGPECSDHTGALRLPEFETRLVELTEESIVRFGSDADRIELGNLDSIDDYPLQLRSDLRASGRIVRLEKAALCPVVDLPGEWDTFLKQFSSNFRSQIRRHYRRIENHDTWRFRTVDAADAEQFTKELVYLNRSRMDSKGKISTLEDPAFRRFLLDAVPAMARDGLAWLDVVEDDESTVGAALNLVFGDTVYYYMGGFDESAKGARPGTALFARVIMRSIELGYKHYDFLRGADAYKYRWGAVDVPTYRMDVYPRRRIAGRMQYTLDSFRENARATIRSIRLKIRGAQ